MEAESSYSSSTRKEDSVSDAKPYCESPYDVDCLNTSVTLVAVKLRLGGSRSVVTGKFLKDDNPSPRLDSSKLSLQQTRSLDSQSVSSRSTDSSGNPDKVRIVGRGGAGARRRNYTVEDKRIGSGPTIELKAMKKKPQVVQDAPIVRNMGRGGLGSRPQPRKNKAAPVNTDTKDTRKVSKQFSRNLLEPNARSQQSPERPGSPLSTISTIHFAGETGLPTPDFFKVTKRRRQKNPNEIDELLASGSNEVFDLQPLRRDTPSTVPWDDTPSTSQSNLSSRSNLKARRRERGFSMLFSIFQNDVTRKTDSSSSLPSMSVPSQITLTSIDTDPSYFFHGPSTPPCSQETDSMTESSYSARLSSSLSSFQREHSPPSIPTSKAEDSQEVEIPKPSLPPPNRMHYPLAKRREIARSLTLYLSPSEAEALEHSPPCSPFLQQYPPTIPEEEVLISTERSEKSESWSGEWNAGMVDVIKALRELR